MLNENRSANQPVHPCILICTIDVYCLGCVLEILVFIACTLSHSLCTIDNLNPKTVCFVWFYALCPSQQFFSRVGAWSSWVELVLSSR